MTSATARTIGFGLGLLLLLLFGAFLMVGFWDNWPALQGIGAMLSFFAAVLTAVFVYLTLLVNENLARIASAQEAINRQLATTAHVDRVRRFAPRLEIRRKARADGKTTEFTIQNYGQSTAFDTRYASRDASPEDSGHQNPKSGVLAPSFGGHHAPEWEMVAYSSSSGPPQFLVAEYRDEEGNRYASVLEEGEDHITWRALAPSEKRQPTRGETALQTT